jgi:hypothetical protein
MIVRADGLPRKKRGQETAQHRSERMEQQARARIEQASAQDKALDAAVRRSIELHGA